VLFIAECSSMMCLCGKIWRRALTSCEQLGCLVPNLGLLLGVAGKELVEGACDVRGDCCSLNVVTACDVGAGVS
jgi:hypothetical protein